MALSLAESNSEEPADIGIKLLADIRAAFDESKADRIATTALLTTLHYAEENPWHDWAHGRGLNDRGLSTLLRPLAEHSPSL